MHCSNQISMCKCRMMPCDHVGTEDQCPLYNQGCTVRGNVPTLGLVIAMYTEMCGAAMTDHQRAILREIRKLLASEGIAPTDSADRITYDVVDHYVHAQNVKNVSRIGKCQRIQALFGRQARIYYRRRGYDVRSVDVPVIEDDSRAYKSLTPARLFDVLGWYRSLQFASDRRGRIFAMLMLKYAMRNGDVKMLRWSNFERSGVSWRLNYTPHKTEKSTAGRSVTIWLEPMDQIELAAWKGAARDDEYVIPRAPRKHGQSLGSLQRHLNAGLRTIGFAGSKGLYELRKLCIDTVFHLHGAEAAAAYSGDDYKTVVNNG